MSLSAKRFLRKGLTSSLFRGPPMFNIRIPVFTLGLVEEYRCGDRNRSECAGTKAKVAGVTALAGPELLAGRKAKVFNEFILLL